MTSGRKVGFILLAVVTALLAVMPTAYARLSGAERENAIKATVLVLTLDNDKRIIASGSGDIVDERGLLLTNFHVVGDPETGELYNEDGLVAIGITRNSRRPAVPTYIAQVVKGDPEIDLALVRIVADVEGNELNSCQKLPKFDIGSSEELSVGDEIALVGFPGIGGQSVTLTFGSVSGFDSEGDTTTWIKTDALANPGNSGGAAVNDAGELVGILTAGITPEGGVGGTIGLVRPIERGEALLTGLSKVGVGGCGSGSAGTAPGPEIDTGITGEGAVEFLGFTLSDAEDAEFVTEAPSGTTALYGNFQYSDIPAETPVQAQWSFNGEVLEDSIIDLDEWPLDPGDGAAYISTENASGFDDGTYTLELRVGNLPIITEEIVVGGEGSGGVTTDPNAEEVTFTGRVVSADTGKPLRGAVFLILAPGITLDDFDPENEDHIFDLAETDRQGNFETTRPVGMDDEFSVAIFARGYEPIGMDGFVPSDFGSDSVIDLGDIELKKR